MPGRGEDDSLSRHLHRTELTVNYVVIISVFGTSGGCVVLNDCVGANVTEIRNPVCYVGASAHKAGEGCIPLL